MNDQRVGRSQNPFIVRGVANQPCHTAGLQRGVALISTSSSSLLISSLELRDTKVYEPQIRALLGTAYSGA